MSIRIVADSAADMADHFRNLTIQIPMTLSFGDEEYIDGVTIDKDTFYRKMETSESFPKTSQPSLAYFEKVYRELKEKGDEGLVITQTSRGSGTYQSACMVAKDYPNIRVLDSYNASVGAGVLAEYALQCVEKGMNLNQLADHLEEKKADIGVFARMDTLKYAVKGGRVSKTAAIAGNILNIKPLITIRDGLVVMAGKARGIKKANKLLLDKVEELGIDYSMPFIFGYSGVEKDSLQEFVKMGKSLWEGHVSNPDCTQICSSIGCHMGPGAVAIAFFIDRTKQR